MDVNCLFTYAPLFDMTAAFAGIAAYEEVGELAQPDISFRPTTNILVFLGIVFLFLWVIVLVLERRQEGKKRDGVPERKVGGEEDKLP